MKKIALAITLLAPWGMFAADTRKIQSIVINSEVLRLIDGTSFINIAQILHFGHQIRILQYGAKDEATGKPVGILIVNGKHYSLKQLIELEKETVQNYKEVLAEAINYFTKVSEPYLEEAKGTKEYMVDLIQKWSKQRNKPSTPLLEWSKLECSEQEAFRRNVLTLTDLDEFCDDLTLFLADLIRSCEKSWKQYKLILQQMQHHK